MRVVLAGGSGFLGRALQERLRADGNDVLVLTRRRSQRPGEIQWQPDGTAGAWANALEGVAVVINLAGEGIADKRWTNARKTALRESRLQATRSIVAAMRRLANPPPVLVNASGIDYYSGGTRPDQIATETTPPGSDFLARLCVDWEQEAEQASPIARVAIVRSAPVLHASGGALRRMLLPFRMGIGGRLGSGAQYFPWIHLDDWVSLVLWMTTTVEARGAFNATAPTPITNAEFTRALGRALHRPTLIPVPAFALRLAVGELADTLLSGRPAIPEHAQKMGFRFRFPEISSALDDLL